MRSLFKSKFALKGAMLGCMLLGAFCVPSDANAIRFVIGPCGYGYVNGHAAAYCLEYRDGHVVPVVISYFNYRPPFCDHYPSGQGGVCDWSDPPDL